MFWLVFLAADFILIPLGLCLGLFLGLVVLTDLGLKVFQMNMCDLGLEHCFHGFLKDLRPTVWPQEMKMWGFEPQNWFQGLVSHYLAATGHQKIQPQEMRIWGLGLRNCFREFSGTCVPLSGRSRPPKIQPEEMRIWGFGRQNCFREFAGTCVPLPGRSRPPKIQPQEMRI